MIWDSVNELLVYCVGLKPQNLNDLTVLIYEKILSDALDRVPNTVDKREGSVIFDAIAPACYEIARVIEEILKIYTETFADTSHGEFLDLRAKEQGLTRYYATYAVKRGIFAKANGDPAEIQTGERFSTISDTQGIIYKVIDEYTDPQTNAAVPGSYRLMCEESGTVGNGYTGAIIPMSFIQGLASATLVDLLTPARNEETDDDFRKRYFEAVNQKAFGGNIAQYKKEVKEIPGVGDVQVYPVWEGGGTVKLSVVDTEYNPISSDFIHDISVLIDPENADGETGDGLGLAPIDHKVTVVTPETVTIDISADIVLKTGFSIGQVQKPVEDVIKSYILEIRKDWAVGDDYNRYFCDIYAAKINAAILSVKGISNARDITINGSPDDLSLIEDKITQQIPAMGTVVLNG